MFTDEKAGNSTFARGNRFDRLATVLASDKYGQRQRV